MSDFTQGKWEVDCIYGDHWIVCAGERIIIDCFKSEANARLIAAAPEMYHWLSGLLCYVYEANALTTNSGAKKETAQDIAQVEALLARIDGKEAQS